MQTKLEASASRGKFCTGSGSQLNGDKLIMPYRDRLNGWLVVRLLPKMQRVVVGRFRSHSDAEGHLQALRRLIPEAQLVIMFDCEFE